MMPYQRELKIITYGVETGMIDGRYGMRVNGSRVGTATYARYDTALAKALAFAQRLFTYREDSWMQVSWHYEFQQE